MKGVSNYNSNHAAIVEIFIGVINCFICTVLPVMLSSKLLPEMETEDNSKKEQILLGLQNLPVPTQIEKLKVKKLFVICV